MEAGGSHSSQGQQAREGVVERGDGRTNGNGMPEEGGQGPHLGGAAQRHPCPARRGRGLRVILFMDGGRWGPQGAGDRVGRGQRMSNANPTQANAPAGPANVR